MKGALGSIEWDPSHRPRFQEWRKWADVRRAMHWAWIRSQRHQVELPYMFGAMLFDASDKAPLNTAPAGIFHVAQLLRTIFKNFRTHGSE